ncbi:MAG: DUF4350 domain-containing protein, partial [Planctomycetes bacterium]|nr:DUF4350 domain-containing protein [Planctomycetota bacterium]
MAGWLSHDERTISSSSYPSTYGRGPWGLAGFYELLGRLDVPCGRWSKSFDDLAGSPVGTLVVGWPSLRAISEAETKAVMGWVSRGHTLVVLSPGLERSNRSGSQLASQLGVEAGAQDTEEDADAFWKGQPGTKTLDAALPLAANRSAARLAVEEGAEPLIFTKRAAFLPLYTSSGSPYVVQVPRGRGTVLISSSAAMFSNGFILKEENLRFVLALARTAAGSGGMYFDEY